MKKLHLIRHAKSSWKDSSLADIDRPLNKRGLESCQIMAQQILNAGCDFKHVFCSTAVRAQATIEHISQSLIDRNIQWHLDDALYTFNNQDLFLWWQTLDDSIPEVVMIGHNPAITDFCNEVSDSDIDNIPTCGYVQLAFDQNLWRDLSEKSTRQLHFLKPKMFM